MTRRKFIITTALFSTAMIVWTCNRDRRGDLLKIQSSTMPYEGDIHQQTWLSFNSNSDQWKHPKREEIKRNIILIAGMIAQYEPVSILVGKKDRLALMDLLGSLDTHHYPVNLYEFQMNDFRMRDTGPAFVLDKNGRKAGINFNSNLKDENTEQVHDAKVANFVSTQTNAKIIRSNLLLKNGCFEVDGSGTAIMTESCILNDEHNPYWDKIQVETELKSLLGLQKIIWLKGIEDKRLTHAHTDFYARFVKEGRVLVHRNNDKISDDYAYTRENIEILQSETDAKGNALKVIIVDAPKNVNNEYGSDHFASGYLGYYLCNRAIIMQTFGDKKADQNAKKILQLAFPDRTIEQIQIDALSAAGGSIHTATLQEPQFNL